MGTKTNVYWRVGTLALCLLLSGALRAQAAQATISGTIADTSGKAVPHAKVSIENLATGQLKETRTDANGRYSVSDLAPGQYEISVAKPGFTEQTSRVTLKAGGNQNLNLALATLAGKGGTLSLQSLGFPTTESQGSLKEQALLNKRSHMLQIHQKLGMLTAIPMVAMIITGPMAKGHHGTPGSVTMRNVHMGLGILTSAMYWATAYYAIRAPKVPGSHSYGLIRLHKFLAWIHGPGMIITPILGAIAYSQLSNGERIHGIAKFHSVAAYTTAIAYGAAFASVAVK